MIWQSILGAILSPLSAPWPGRPSGLFTTPSGAARADVPSPRAPALTALWLAAIGWLLASALINDSKKDDE